jgi:hypothetical protein
MPRIDLMFSYPANELENRATHVSHTTAAAKTYRVTVGIQDNISWAGAPMENWEQ